MNARSPKIRCFRDGNLLGDALDPFLLPLNRGRSVFFRRKSPNLMAANAGASRARKGQGNESRFGANREANDATPRERPSPLGDCHPDQD